MDDELILEETPELEVDAETGELIELEQEYPMYTVVWDTPSEIFSMYTILILSVLIMYPIYRVLRTIAGSVNAWKK